MIDLHAVPPDAAPGCTGSPGAAGRAPHALRPPYLTKVFHGVSPDGGRRLEIALAFTALRRGESVYATGDPGERVYFVRSGLVKLVLEAGTRDTVLRFVDPGQVFGETALVDDAAYDHYAVACESSLVASATCGQLRRLGEELPDLRAQIALLMARHLRGVSRRLAHGNELDATRRIGRALLDLAADHGVHDDRGLLIAIRLSQQDLADFAGLARPTVNGVLVGLRAKGILAIEDRRFRLIDPDAFAALL